jgi:hypothetical protein
MPLGTEQGLPVQENTVKKGCVHQVINNGMKDENWVRKEVWRMEAAQTFTNCTLWLLRLPISTSIGMSAIPSPSFVSALDEPFSKSAGPLIRVLGLVALLTLTLLAIPTVAVCVLGPTTLVLR